MSTEIVPVCRSCVSCTQEDYLICRYIIIDVSHLKLTFIFLYSREIFPRFII